MSADGYGLGIDIGNATIRVAACSPDDGGCAEPVHIPPGRDADRLGPLLARVGDPVPLYVDGRPVPAAHAVAAAITDVADRVAARLGAPAARTVVTVPPSWNEHRRAALAAALHGSATLVSSAVAVTRHGRATGAVPAAATVAVYDLGASTLDTAVVRAGEDGDLAHVAPPPAPLPWGGRDVDDAVVRHVRGFLPAAPRTLRAACVAAKEALSTQTDVRVEVGEKTRPIRLVREDLDELLADALAESVTALRSAVAGAGLAPAQLDGIVLAGGSARLPAVAEALSAELGRPVLVTAAPELAAACGAAELALDLLAAPAVPPVQPVVVADEEELADDQDDDESEPDADVEDDDELAELRERRRSVGSSTASRIAVVAAFFVAILITPVTLLAALDSGVLDTHGAGAASAADSPPATTPPAPDSPAAATEAATAPTGETAAATHRTTGSGGHPTPATTSRNRSTTAGRSTASHPAPASTSSAAPAAVAAPVAPVAPVDTTTGTTAPAPAADPVTAPPATDPPATAPPATDPPADPPADPPTDPAPPPAVDPASAPDPGAAPQAAA